MPLAFRRRILSRMFCFSGLRYESPSRSIRRCALGRQGKVESTLRSVPPNS